MICLIINDSGLVQLRNKGNRKKDAETLTISIISKVHLVMEY